MRPWFSICVMTHQKAMLGRNAFTRRKPVVPFASLAISAASLRTLRSPMVGIGTELLAHREKIEVTRSGSPFERSPVPMARAHRPTRELFGVLSELVPEIETGWRSELNSNCRYRFLKAR